MTQYKGGTLFLLLTIKYKSAAYSKIKSKIRRKLKDNLKKQIYELEQTDRNLKPCNADHYEYLKRRLKQIEDFEIEGYKKE